MLIVGITGLMGSGKSFVSNEFESLGAKLYNTDKVAKFLQVGNYVLKESLINNFGKNYYNGLSVNSDYVKSLIFNNENGIKNLNKITALVGSFVKCDFIEFCNYHQNEDYILIESAILYETGLNNLCDLTINVKSNNPHLAAEKRSNVSKLDWDFLMATQLPENNKTFDFVITNDYTDNVISQVNIIHSKILNYA